MMSEPILLSDPYYSVLVVNSSQEMAKEITLQLTLKLPGCSIMYAPSIELARWIVQRKEIDLIVSCPLLPDGSISSLQADLARMEHAPSVIVVGDIATQHVDQLQKAGYQFARVRRLAQSVEKILPSPPRSSKQIPLLEETIQTLGADIRNDLNNPLQEIVAMVFVAQAGHEAAPATGKALEAIDSAAKNMAKVVNQLEEKIRQAVTPVRG